MITETGRKAVWQHAKECGIADDIAMIAKHFDIVEVNIFANGKFTYIENHLRKMHRIVAVPSEKFLRTLHKEEVARAKQAPSRLKR